MDCTSKEDNVFAKIEKTRNVFLAESFNFIGKCIIIKPTKIAKILENMYSQNRLNTQEFEQIENAILNGKNSLKFKEFFLSRSANLQAISVTKVNM